MTLTEPPQQPEQPVAAPVTLVLIAATHLAYPLAAGLRDFPFLPPALALSLILGVAYATAAWLARRERGFALAVNLIIGEDVGVLAAGVLLGYPWADYLRPGAVLLVALQLALAFAEIVHRQAVGRPIAPPARFAYFLIVYLLALAAYGVLKPPGLWGPGTDAH